MRKIKFRGKDKKGIWRIGDLMTLEHFIADSKDKFQIGDFDTSTVYDIDNETIGQFTGLHDKNGKEIYEGDAWEEEDGYNIIVWNEKYACFAVDIYGFTEWIGEGGQECYGNEIEFIDREFCSAFDFEKIEITSNIYDNPELLKGADNIE